MKFAIVGAGISGLSTARLLQDQGHEVIVFEKKEKAGGLIACEWVQDCLFHKVGGHVFNSKNQEVLNWFWKYFDKEQEFVSATRNAKVYINNLVIGYPIENYLYMLDANTLQKVILELIELQKNLQKPPNEYSDFEAFLRGNFGDTLFEIYFGPYNNKLWRTDLSEVAMEWLEGKLPMPQYPDIILSNILRKEEGNMVHSTFFYPRSGGSQFIIDRLAETLDIRLNNTITEVSFHNEKLALNGEEGFDHLIWSANIKSLPAEIIGFLKEEGVNTGYIQNLHANGTSNLFCETDDTNISWLYIPGAFTKAHRIIYTGNFSADNNRGSERKTCVVEFSGKVEFSTMVDEIKKLPGNLHPLNYNYEASSYVVQDKQTRPVIASAKSALRKKNIFLLGRFAEWEYYNMDKCIEAGMNLVKQFQS